MNVYVKMAFSENIARKVCTLFLIDIDNVFFFFLFFNCAIPFYIFTQNKSTPPKFRSIAQGRGPRVHMTTPQTQNVIYKLLKPSSLQIPIRCSCINSKKKAELSLWS